MVKLSTGKELELKELNRADARSLKYASALGFDPFKNNYFDRAALLGTGLKLDELEKTYSDEEIIEIAGLVFEKMTLSDTQKKS